MAPSSFQEARKEVLCCKRITLPPDDKKFMPSEGKPPLKAGGNCLDQSLDRSRERLLK